MKTIQWILCLFLVALALVACEDAKESEEKTEEAPAKATPADLGEIDIEKISYTLDRTLLNAHASRDMALADVAEKIFAVPREDSTSSYLATVCAEVVEGGCDNLRSEAHYFAVLSATMGKLSEAATSQGKADVATAMTARATGVASSLREEPVKIPEGDEPLFNLIGDPTLAVTSQGLVTLMGPFATRSVAPLVDPEAEEADPNLIAYFDAIKQNDTFTALGIPPVMDDAGKPILPGDGTLQLTLDADMPAQALVDLGGAAYAAKVQSARFVVRSREYKTLGFFEMNFVKASTRGSDFGMEIKAEGVTWYDTSGEEEKTQAVSWEDLDRLGEIARQPQGQVVLYVGVAPEVTGQQLFSALSAARKRCGDQEACASLQMGLALKKRPAGE